MQNTINNEILKQKDEFTILGAREYMPRYLDNKKEEYVKSPLVKVILGPRRAGKSTFARSMCHGKNVAYLNFDSKALSEIEDHNVLLEGLKEIYKHVDIYFFDEIQNLDKWEYLVNELHRLGKNVIITGSNSKLLSRELSTALTGRHIAIHINTFSYLEYIQALNLQRGIDSYQKYIATGGYPEMIQSYVGTHNGSGNQNYINTLLDSVILRDVVDRYKIRNYSQLKSLADYLLKSPATPVTSRSLERLLHISQGTIIKYIDYLEEVFSIIHVNRYSLKARERMASYKKIYPSDISIYNVKKDSPTDDKGKQLEVFIACELYKKTNQENTSINYFKTKNGKEVDFVLSKNGKALELVQVCYRLDFQNYKRETTALLEASKEVSCEVMTVYVYELAEDLYKEKSIDNAGNTLGSLIKIKYAWEV